MKGLHIWLQSFLQIGRQVENAATPGVDQHRRGGDLSAGGEAEHAAPGLAIGVQRSEHVSMNSN